jgi:hypothetical protein
MKTHKNLQKGILSKLTDIFYHIVSKVTRGIRKKYVLFPMLFGSKNGRRCNFLLQAVEKNDNIN